MLTSLGLSSATPASGYQHLPGPSYPPVTSELADLVESLVVSTSAHPPQPDPRHPPLRRSRKSPRQTMALFLQQLDPGTTLTPPPRPSPSPTFLRIHLQPRWRRDNSLGAFLFCQRRADRAPRTRPVLTLLVLPPNWGHFLQGISCINARDSLHPPAHPKSKTQLQLQPAPTPYSAALDSVIRATLPKFQAKT